MVIFTSVCANYVHKARVLAQSVKQHIPDAKMVLCLVEREIDPKIPADYFDDVVLAKDVWEGDFDRFIFKHTIVEASTSVKGQFFRYLMDRFTEEDYFVYLDPDVKVYGDFVELRKELQEHPIVLCPHVLIPGNVGMELASTAHGVYNLGFLGISRSAEGRRCIDWWAERLALYCYDDIQGGVFTDQKWFDLVPCFFDAKIFKNHGYDFAHWSLKGSIVTCDENGYYVNGDPLRFLHFSAFGGDAVNSMAQWAPEEDHLFRKLYAEYAVEHDANDSDGISKTPWSYGFYHSGEKIENVVRWTYRNKLEEAEQFGDPFALSNEEFIDRLHIWIPDKNAMAKWKRRMNKAAGVLKQEGIGALVAAYRQWRSQ